MRLIQPFHKKTHFVFFILSCFASVSLPVKGQTVSYRFQGAKVKVLDQDGSHLRVTKNDSVMVFTILDIIIKKEVATYHKGDIVDLEFDKTATGNTLKSINISIHKVEPRQRIWTLIFVGVAIYGFLALLLRRNPKYLIVGEDNLYSNSKFQIVLWFYILIINYIIINIFRGMVDPDLIGRVNIPQNLLLLSGISTLTFGAAKGITQSKVDAGKEQREKASLGDERFPRDLFMNAEGQVDMADFQMVVITLLAVGTYIVQVYSFLGVQELYSVVTLPDVDSTILAVFGLGQGAYLTKKFVGGINS